MKRSLPIELTENQFLSDRYDYVIPLIYKERRLVIDANLGIGKTRLFIELGKEIKSGKRNGRLIFCAPYLVIQSQFNTALKKEGYEADLIVNANAKRKKLDPSDKIVISTFPGLKHIIQDLNDDDIIVMDESHTLAYSYATGENRAYYDQTIEYLYNSNANIVLLSGTPNQEINDLLELTSVEVTKIGHPKSEVSIYHSYASPVQIALAFAKEALQEHGDDSLNIIYIKDRNACEQIREALEDEGYNSKVITSYHKKQDHYKQLVEYSKVGKGIQFLICTNVISTGTNVENANIGMALMIGEYNPDEIKQFSKRFRDKLDIKVDLVINPSQRPFLSIDGDLEDSIKKVENDLSTIREQLGSIKDSNLPESYPNSYESGLNRSQTLCL
jgi:hypothetical protein